ncbi:MAG: recombinase family protein, partial [Alphaproteobacteria bacterium]|nr:recombinase family protein [Alphaproteobacteria bacterium]
ASRGRKKKRLAIHEGEASTVRLIYRLYLEGHQGRNMGCKEIGKYLTEKGLRMRGGAWNTHKIHDILSDTLYMGDYYFNVVDSKTKQKRPPEEWVRTSIPPIIDAELFEQVRKKRELRSPDQTAPRQLTSNTLLTGLLFCGHCGSAMTLATGKSGKYKYYKCTRRISQGNHACESGNFPMKKTDEHILFNVTDMVFTDHRLKEMIAALKTMLRGGLTATRAALTS